MPLTFAVGSSDKVDHGSAAVLDNVNAGTLMAWVRINSLTPSNPACIYAKGTNGALTLLRLQMSAAGAWTIVRQRATTSCQATSAGANFAAWGASKWCFVAAVWDTAGVNGDQKLYIGDETTDAAEPSSYSTQTVGSGAVGSNAADNACIGNLAAGGSAFDGSIDFVSHYSSILTLAQIKEVQFSMRILTNDILHVYLGREGTGTQLDYSGQGNNGTITGATVGTTPFSLHGRYARRRRAA